MVKATGCFVRAGRSRLGCQCFCGGRGWAVQVEDTAFSKALWPSGRTLHLPSLEEAGMAWQAEKAGGGGGGAGHPGPQDFRRCGTASLAQQEVMGGAEPARGRLAGFRPEASPLHRG